MKGAKNIVWTATNDQKFLRAMCHYGFLSLNGDQAKQIADFVGEFPPFLTVPSRFIQTV